MYFGESSLDASVGATEVRNRNRLDAWVAITHARKPNRACCRFDGAPWWILANSKSRMMRSFFIWSTLKFNGIVFEVPGRVAF